VCSTRLGSFRVVAVGRDRALPAFPTRRSSDLAAPAADRARGDREPCGLSGLAAGLGDDGRGGAGRRRLRRLHRPLIRPATTPPGIIDSKKLLSVFHITGNYATLSVITLSWRSHGPE